MSPRVPATRAAPHEAGIRDDDLSSFLIRGTSELQESLAETSRCVASAPD